MKRYYVTKTADGRLHPQGDAVGALNKITCKRCHQFATLQSVHDGTKAYVCRCGQQYAVKSL